MALGEGLGSILTTFRTPDPSIPLAAWDRLVLLAAGELGEAALRAPVVICGLATPLLAWLASRTLGRSTALAWAWLLALSPSLVYYGRIARPYGVVVVLATLAAAAFLAWWEWRGRGWATLYATSAPLAVWFHPGVAPFVVAPFVFAALDGARRRHGGATWRRLPALVALGVVTAAVLALLVAPALPSLGGMLADIGGGGAPPTAAGWLAVLSLQAGSGRAWLVLVVWSLVGLGGLLLARRHPSLIAYLAILAGIQVGAFVAFAPYGAGGPVIANRYLLALQPVVLLLAAVGLSALVARLAPATATSVVVALVALGWLAGGPYAADPGLRFGPFAGSNDAIGFHRAPSSLDAARLPPAYAALEAAADATLVEAVWPPEWALLQAPLALQAHHGERVVIAFAPHGAFADPRLQLRHAVPAVPSRLLASEGRWLMLHRRPRALARATLTPAWRLAALEAGTSRSLARRLRRLWGPPDLEDRRIEVWDLERVRRSAPPAPGPARR